MPTLKMGMFIIVHESLTNMDSFLDNHLMILKSGQVNMLVQMRLIRRKIHLILLYGKQLSPAKLVGIHHGEKVVQDGISNVQCCLLSTWARQLIFMQGDKTLNSLTMKMRLPKVKQKQAKNLFVTGCIMVS